MLDKDDVLEERPNIIIMFVIYPRPSRARWKAFCTPQNVKGEQDHCLHKIPHFSRKCALLYIHRDQTFEAASSKCRKWKKVKGLWPRMMRNEVRTTSHSGRPFAGISLPQALEISQQMVSVTQRTQLIFFYLC